MEVYSVIHCYGAYYSVNVFKTYNSALKLVNNIMNENYKDMTREQINEEGCDVEIVKCTLHDE